MFLSWFWVDSCLHLFEIKNKTQKETKRRKISSTWQCSKNWKNWIPEDFMRSKLFLASISEVSLVASKCCTLIIFQSRFAASLWNSTKPFTPSTSKGQKEHRCIAIGLIYLVGNLVRLMRTRSRIAFMETMKTPLHLESTQGFVADQATEKCHRLLPECSFGTSPTLVEALAQLFSFLVEELWLRVCDIFNLDDRAIQTTIEKWLMDHSIMCKEYLRCIVNRHTVVDRLFLWLSVHASQQHINVVHPGGIWTSRWSEIVVLTDATITLVVNCFLLSLKMEQFSVQDDSFFIKPLSDPRLVQDNFVIMPQVLNKPVGNIQE